MFAVSLQSIVASILLLASQFNLTTTMNDICLLKFNTNRENIRFIKVTIKNLHVNIVLFLTNILCH